MSMRSSAVTSNTGHRSANRILIQERNKGCETFASCGSLATLLGTTFTLVGKETRPASPLLGALTIVLANLGLFFSNLNSSSPSQNFDNASQSIVVASPLNENVSINPGKVIADKSLVNV